MLLAARHFSNHRGDECRTRDQLGLKIVANVYLRHSLGSTTVRHRRTGVAINRLVSSEEDDPALL